MSVIDCVRHVVPSRALYLVRCLFRDLFLSLFLHVCLYHVFKCFVVPFVLYSFRSLCVYGCVLLSLLMLIYVCVSLYCCNDLFRDWFLTCSSIPHHAQPPLLFCCISFVEFLLLSWEWWPLSNSWACKVWAFVFFSCLLYWVVNLERSMICWRLRFLHLPLAFFVFWAANVDATWALLELSIFSSIFIL